MKFVIVHSTMTFTIALYNIMFFSVLLNSVLDTAVTLTRRI